MKKNKVEYILFTMNKRAKAVVNISFKKRRFD